MRVPLAISLFFMLMMTQTVPAQTNFNYDETKVPQFDLPKLLVSEDGQKIKSTADWETIRRPELLSFFEEEIYGKVPGALDGVRFEPLEQAPDALNGRALRKQVRVILERKGATRSFTLLLYLPNNRKNVPVFLGYNFFGNHTVHADPQVQITKAWNRNAPNLNIDNNRATEASRGVRAHRWDIDRMIQNGFGLATLHYGEVDPDKNDATDGVQSLFYGTGQQRPKENEWGSIAAWAFGLGRAMDYLEQDANVGKVIVFGHSRLGKAALWAGATDHRFSAVISNNSGCGGAALSKIRFGETVARINTNFPHWFADRFNRYNDQEGLLPTDQHGLLALMAPRPLYVASATEDEWADPKGEFLALRHTAPVYALYKKRRFTRKKMPAPNRPIHRTVAYHLRTGAHDVTSYDWKQYIRWAKKVVVPR
ncbi:acetylxylan esterase [Maribacter sp. 2307ULW6-5]|uniref:glucuronyl esterase domain-containing protein n=1 Tax=Maribacter sp. 2307ULW6-5 TaxID=3386275 RepID=UPI0039BCDB97